MSKHNTRDAKGRFTFSETLTEKQQRFLNHHLAKTDKSNDEIEDAFLDGYDLGVTHKSRDKRAECFKNWRELRK